MIRGVVALVGSLAIGMKALGISANAQIPVEEVDADDLDAEDEGDAISGGVWFGTVLVSLVFAIGLFFVAPVGLTSLIRDQLGSSWLFWLVEGLIRTAIFLGYLTLLSRMRDLRRVFEYHGAEHKVISCFEAGDELTPERASRYSRLHPRCGTSFLLVVMIMAIFVFAPVGLPAWWILVLTRIVGVPVIAGLSFEVIKWAGPQPGPARGCSGSCTRAAAAEADHPRARSRPAGGLDRGAAGGARGGDARARRPRTTARRRSRRLSGGRATRCPRSCSG